MGEKRDTPDDRLLVVEECRREERTCGEKETRSGRQAGRQAGRTKEEREKTRNGRAKGQRVRCCVDGDGDGIEGGGFFLERRG